MRCLAAAACAAALSGVVLHSVAQPTAPVDILIGGVDANVDNYRIPALLRTDKGTLIVVAEARTQDNDCEHKWLVVRRSTDNGTTWSPIADVYGRDLPGGQTAGNPVLMQDAQTGRVILHFALGTPTQCNPTKDTLQLDDGGSDGVAWGNSFSDGPVHNLSSMLAPWAGILPGPGTGVQLPTGRLLVVGHYGAYQTDIVWHSDDHGKTWQLSQTQLPKLDEPAIAVLSNGSVMVNARTAHLNPACDCRAVSVSADGGDTFGPIVFDNALIEPVCEGSLATVAGALYFSNPASTTARANITVRVSHDDGRTWPRSYLVWGPSGFGGYSCIAPSATAITRADGQPTPARQYGAIVWERTNASSPKPSNGRVISFALFPLDLAPTS